MLHMHSIVAVMTFEAEIISVSGALHFKYAQEKFDTERKILCEAKKILLFSMLHMHNIVSVMTFEAEIISVSGALHFKYASGKIWHGDKRKHYKSVIMKFFELKN